MLPNPPTTDDHLRVDMEWMSGLELLDTKVYPLPGAVHRRVAGPDPRLSHLSARNDDVVCFYEHIASLRHKPSGEVFVVFRQTMDALLLEQQDPVLYPEWLMKSRAKKAELSIYIYRMKHKPNHRVRTHNDWLEHIPDSVRQNTLAYFLLGQKVISVEAYGSMQ